MQWVVENQGETLTQGAILYGVDFGYGEHNPLCIVMSNACDFENDKLSFVVLAILVPAKETLINTREVSSLIGEKKSIAGMSQNSKKALRKIYLDKIYNRTIGRYYFFDPRPTIEMDPLLVDFQHSLSCELPAIMKMIDNGKVRIIGRLDHPFVEQMMLQYAGYMGRVPSDRLSEDSVQVLIDGMWAQ